MGEETTIIGTVMSVVFQNEENGYAVLRLVTDDGELLTLVGCVPCAAPGEELILTGRYTTHPQHGEQFAADEVERHMPTGETEILNYLASGVVRGVGPATAEKLVARFGEETLRVLESEPEKLTAIKGMTSKRAQEISNAFNEQMGLRRVMEFLAHYDLSAALSVPLYRRFGANAMAALERNPYLLSDSAFGVDFSVCDEIALSMGFGGDASLRTEAGLIFELSHNREAGGHVFLPREKLLAATVQLLDCDVDAAEKSLDDLIERKRIVQEPVANVTACYLRASWEDESYVVTRISAMLADKPDALRGVERVIAEIEREQGVQYAPLQRQAVELAAKEELLLLTGGPGTGKTTSVRAIVALFERMGLSVLLAAPTGRAAKRMGELCDREAQTIHRMLGMTWNDQTGEVTFTKGEKEPLEADALIVDETSMVDLALMRALLAALRPGCRLVLVGDPDQLPSVGAGNVLREMIRSKAVPTTRLSVIFRQAQDNPIVGNSLKINQGCTNLTFTNTFCFIERSAPEEILRTACAFYVKAVKKFGLENVILLNPFRNKGLLSVNEFNRQLQNLINPPIEGEESIKIRKLEFRPRDLVMQTKNTEIAMNGDIGVIHEISKMPDPDDMNRWTYIASIEFNGDGKRHDYTPEMMQDLDLAYCTTVHKSQGSEYQTVIMVVSEEHKVMLKRNIIYTGVTRAKQNVALIGQTETLNTAILNNQTDVRHTLLGDRLHAAFTVIS